MQNRAELLVACTKLKWSSSAATLLTGTGLETRCRPSFNKKFFNFLGYFVFLVEEKQNFPGDFRFSDKPINGLPFRNSSVFWRQKSNSIKLSFIRDIAINGSSYRTIWEKKWFSKICSTIKLVYKLNSMFNFFCTNFCLYGLFFDAKISKPTSKLFLL